jgi:hypothetical protein
MSLSPVSRVSVRARPLVALAVAAFALGCTDEAPEPAQPTLVGAAAPLQCTVFRRGGAGNVADTVLAQDQAGSDPRFGQLRGRRRPPGGHRGDAHPARLLRFDLASIPAGALVTSATLSLRKAYSMGSGSLGVSARRRPGPRTWSPGALSARPGIRSRSPRRRSPRSPRGATSRRTSRRRRKPGSPARARTTDCCSTPWGGQGGLRLQRIGRTHQSPDTDGLLRPGLLRGRRAERPRDGRRLWRALRPLRGPLRGCGVCGPGCLSPRRQL